MKSNQQKGFVLIYTLIILAIFSLIVTFILKQQHDLVQNTEAMKKRQQLQQLNQAAVLWGKQALQSQINGGNFPQQWQQKVAAGVIIKITLIDLQAKLNVNNMINPLYKNNFIKLCQLKKLPMKQIHYMLTKLFIESHIFDIITPAEWQQLLLSMHLSRIKLDDVFTVLPEAIAININTASIVVLQSLGLSRDQANQIIQNRHKVLYQSNGDFWQRNSNLPHGLQRHITLYSKYFGLSVDINLDKRHFKSYTILKRNGNMYNKASKVIVIWQSV